MPASGARSRGNRKPPARRPGGRRPSASKIRRRRVVAGVILGIVAVVAVVVISLPGKVGDAIQELTLPLRHDDIIRQQAKEKDVDASLIAAVIYSESRFRDQTPPAGARARRQLPKHAALDTARHSGATTFKLSDLGDPQVNISYGTYLLRELLDRYDGNEVAALAAYNAGPG